MISFCCSVLLIFSNSFDVSFSPGQLARRKCWLLHGLRFAQYLVPDPAMLFGYDVGVELRHLRYFAAVVELRNVTRAAGRLRVAQPALSRQIQDLEEELGVKLLERSTRGIKLRNSRCEAGDCSGVRWCHVAARGSRIGPWCGHSARGLPQLGRLTCETAPDRTDTAADDRGLCLHNFKRICCRDTAFPHQRSHRCGGSSASPAFDSEFRKVRQIWR